MVHWLNSTGPCAVLMEFRVHGGDQCRWKCCRPLPKAALQTDVSHWWLIWRLIGTTHHDSVFVNSFNRFAGKVCLIFGFVFLLICSLLLFCVIQHCLCPQQIDIWFWSCILMWFFLFLLWRREQNWQCDHKSGGIWFSCLFTSWGSDKTIFFQLLALLVYLFSQYFNPTPSVFLVPFSFFVVAFLLVTNAKQTQKLYTQTFLWDNAAHSRFLLISNLLSKMSQGLEIYSRLIKQ